MPTVASALATPPIPPADVPGTDLAGLPRYPGSVRVGYRREEAANLAITDVEYVTAVALDHVREFYRGVFRSEGWTDVDARFSEGQWTFFVVSGKREALVLIETRQSLTNIDIHLSEPIGGGGSSPETAMEGVDERNEDGDGTEDDAGEDSDGAGEPLR
jgi:hypothetical protein